MNYKRQRNESSKPTQHTADSFESYVMTTHRPHILIFNPDSYRGDVLGHLNNPGAVTPNVDAMVQHGAVSYANAFAQNPWCTPSRCSFMTGLYPHVQGHRSMKHMLRSHEPNILQVLKHQGYKVWWGGKNDLISVKTREDFFDHVSIKNKPVPARGRRTSPAIDMDDPRYPMYYRGVFEGEGQDWPFVDSDCMHVRAAAQHIAADPLDEPMCMFLPLGNPHPAYAVEKDFYDLIDPAKLPPRLGVPQADHPVMNKQRDIFKSHRLSEDHWREIKHVYYAMCAKVDALFGQVVTALKNRGIYDNTLIIFLSDHGDLTGDLDLPEKPVVSLHDALLRVPLVIKPPANVEFKPGVRHSLVELVDMCPTIYDLLNIKPGYDMQGQSLQPSLAGDDSPSRPCVFAELGSRPGEDAFHDQDVLNWKATDFYYQKQLSFHDRFVAGSYAGMARTPDFKYIRRRYENIEELYDLQQDPGELHNVAGQPAYAQAQARMKDHLLDHLMHSVDTLPQDIDPRNIN